MIPGKFLFREIDFRAGKLGLPLLSVSQYRGVVLRSELTGDLPRAEDLSGYKVCEEGDIVVNRMSAYQGAMGRSSLAGVVSPDYMVLRPGPLVEGRYLHHLFRSEWFRGEVVQRLRGIGSIELGNVRTPRINPDEFGSIRLRVPPLGEQVRIADFLDRQTKRIDRIRIARERQLDLLAEAAVSRSYDAVRGASVVGKRKDSGLAWLGSVPADWRVGAVSHFFEVELGKMLNQDRTSGEHLRPYLRVANVQWGQFDLSDLAMMDFPPHERLRYRLKAGDLLVNEGGIPGRAAIWGGEIPEIYYQKALHRIRPLGKETVDWLYHCLVVAERLKVFRAQGNTSTITHLTREQLRPQRFPFPDVLTQRNLVAHLDEAARNDVALRSLLQRQLSLIAERRQALITAAVTGQFDVSTASGRNVMEGITA